ncbi:MAG: Smr/MutS family protein [Gemmatimonadota bacterium]|nr:Smr/MutS family protein [Gemmatimonadota bacterium]
MSAAARTHALQVLEFGDVLDLVAREAVGSEGAARVRRLRPGDDAAAIETELAAVDEIRGLLDTEDGFSIGSLPDARPALSRLAIEGASLDPESLIACGVLLATGRLAATDLVGRVEADGRVGRLHERLWSDRELEERIDRSFDESGEVADRASPELRRLRRSLQDRRSRLVDRLEEYSRSLPDRIRVSDGSVTVRSGRYCIPVRREGKGTVGGLVHDASGSRQTLFVEPAMAIDDMNEIRELEIEVKREIDRILAELTAALREHHAELSDTYEALCDLDSLRARAVFARRLECSLPTLLEAGDAMRVRGGRHPLLAARGGVIPFDLDLEPNERVLLISGPNAGGKTVLLKTVGLIVALARSGVIPPVGPGTGIPLMGGPYAIIGDEQSIEASLSTFGAQARNLAEILGAAGPNDLVLIDEIGSATDPAEGGALAAATLAALRDQVRLTIATTHLGDLKGLAEEGGGTVNASLQFDSELLEPTFRLVKNRPGRSYALEIAARLGIPRRVLDDARSRLESDHRSLDTLLARLERDQEELTLRRTELEAARARVERTAEELAAREADVRRRAEALERRAADRVEAALHAARTEVEDAIARLEAEYAGGAAAEDLRASRRETRDVVERGLREIKTRKASRAPAETDPADAGLSVGDRVTWSAGGRSGVLAEVRGDRGVVEVDGLRLTMPVAELALADGSGDGGSSAKADSRRGRGRSAPMAERSERRPALAVATEIDLRGLRVEEVEGRLLPALDAAVVAELPWLRIIHGKGTGALRQVVRDLLELDPRVKEHGSGDVREGGTGVTVVKFE